MNWKEGKKKQSSPNLSYCLDICLEGLMKSAKSMPATVPAETDLNWVPSE
jgi:hypothetical protein